MSDAPRYDVLARRAPPGGDLIAPETFMTVVTLARFAHRRPLAATLWVMAGLSVFFLAFPETDIVVASWFYDPASGFSLIYDPVLRQLREIGLFTPKLIAGILVAALIIKLLLPRVQSLVPPHITLFFLSTLIMGPGLIVNGVFKAEWGRPRPRHTDIFGGELPFMPPWVWSDYCERNCSFVSGEASSSFWMLAFVFVVPKSWRRPALAVLIPYVVLISFNRIFFGAHYLSDVLIAWTINLTVMLILYRYLVKDPPPALSPKRLECGLTAIGLWLRRVVWRA